MAQKALPHRMCDQRVPLTELILKMPQAPGRAEWPASAFGYFAREQSASQSRDCAKKSHGAIFHKRHLARSPKGESLDGTNKSAMDGKTLR